MQKGAYGGFIFGTIILIIGILGLVNTDYLGNTYTADLLFILGLLTYVNVFFFGRSK